MIGDTGCCGFNGQDQGPNLVGILTFSMPMMVLGVLMYPVVFILGVFHRRMRQIKSQLGVIIRANLRLIHKKKFFPMFRCTVAGKLFKLSPWLSGIVYRSFNLTIFVMIWMCALVPVVLIVK